MAKFRAQSGEIHFQHRGSRANPRVLLIHGLGCQLVQWPDSLLNGLVAQGLCVVTFDNRDAGLSHGVDAPPPSLEALLAQRAGTGKAQPAYTLSEMAQDAVYLLDHLGQGGAHVVGLSMGGMIGQRLAIEHPQRVYSLTSIMSSSGDPQPSAAESKEHTLRTEEAERALLATMTEQPKEAAIAANAESWQRFAGPHFDSLEVGIGRFARRAVERAYRPEGTARQLAAILADGDRSAALATVRAPTLVIHGNADPLVDIAAGRATAAAIPSAKFLEVDKMGHDLPEPLIDDLVLAISDHIRTVEVNR